MQPRLMMQLLKRHSAICIVLFAIFVVPCNSVFAFAVQDVQFSDADIEFFENKVRPLLVDHCLSCHGDEEKKVRGGLRLTSRALMLLGGDSGPAIVPGDPDESLIIQCVNYEEFEMPPSGRLEQADIDTLVKWVEMGAPDPRASDSEVEKQEIDIEAGRQFWSFQPRKKLNVELSSVDESGWSKSVIDRLVLERLKAEEIEPVPDASREKLIRRAYIALIGLPPTVQQQDEFQDDQRSLDEAFAEVVDELLNSPHFGERWGRHWLDVARFAESSGGGRSLMFKDAWRFRDYVIDSYNKDKPFDQFVKEQIAGDILPFESHKQKIEQIIASGFLALGPTNYEQQDKERLRMEVIDEQVDTVGRAFLGMTLGCARCHDHKFDPIPMSDYYAMAGIFGGTKSLVDGNVSKYVERSVATESEIKADRTYRKKVTALSEKLAAAKTELKRLGGEIVSAAREKNRKSNSLDGIVIDDSKAELVGLWQESSFIAYFVDGHYLHDKNNEKGKRSVVFSPKIESGGNYEVRLAYSPGNNRATNVPVTVDHQDGKSKILVNQTLRPPIEDLFVSLGTFRFEADTRSAVTVETTDTDGHVIVDAVQFLKAKSEQVVAMGKPAPSDDQSDPSDSGADPNQSKTDPAIETQKELVKRLDKELGELKKTAPKAIPLAMSVEEAAKPVDGHIHIRGSVRNLGPIVQRGFLTVCCEDLGKPKLSPSESGRLQLAHWIADPKHPLTARVYVNRVWRQLFGRGLVETTDNFGSMGTKPSHPELLDYLAEEFVNEGWSTKKLIRKIMLSRVYRLACEGESSGKQKDAENRLLWRAPRRRVDAEVLRDSILYVSGKLNFESGGMTIRKFSQYDLGYDFDTVKRSVYVPAFRNSLLDFFEVFDFANPNLVVGNRNTSTLPTQALFLMNSPVVMEQSKAAAKRLLVEKGMSQSSRIELAYKRFLGRAPTGSELKQAIRYLDDFEKDADEVSAWTSFCHTLYASLDFRFIE